jgi:hypothetical protein
VKLEGCWVAGFVDALGGFHVAINRHPKMKVGYQVLPEFVVMLHHGDVQMLHELKNFFGCGVVRAIQGDRMAFRVRRRGDLIRRIVPFFERYPLKTTTGVEFIRLRRVLRMMARKEHLTLDGLAVIRRIVDQPVHPTPDLTMAD